MRDIKFRVWDIANKSWLKTGDAQPIDGKLISCVDIADYISWPDDYIIQQFTGLQDKNGKDIFEGDILKIQTEDNPEDLQWDIFYIEYYRASFWTRNKQGADHLYDFYSDGHVDGEVIGNIFDNPELVK